MAIKQDNKTKISIAQKKDKDITAEMQSRESVFYLFLHGNYHSPRQIYENQHFTLQK